MPTTDPSVIDISHYQPEPDWDTLWDSGVIGVILKATEGTSYVDPTFVSRRETAWATDLLTASYHYLHHGNATAEIVHYLATIVPEPGERVVIDYEDEALDLKDLEIAVKTLLSAAKNLQITVYGGHKLKEVLTQPNILLTQNTSLWLAQYTTGKPSWPTAVWKYWSLWQYSDAGQVSGISGNVDLNRFNGDDQALRAWLAPAAEPAPPPEPAPVPALVQLMLSSQTPVEITITTTGQATVVLGDTPTKGS